MKTDWLTRALAWLTITGVSYLLFAACAWYWNPGEWHWFLRVVAVLWVALITYKAVTRD